MKSELKRILRRGALIVTLKAAEQASASASAPVIVLDAGHGASR